MVSLAYALIVIAMIRGSSKDKRAIIDIQPLFITGMLDVVIVFFIALILAQTR